MVSPSDAGGDILSAKLGNLLRLAKFLRIIFCFFHDLYNKKTSISLPAP